VGSLRRSGTVARFGVTCEGGQQLRLAPLESQVEPVGATLPKLLGY
jgi:hypothetical protein